MPVPEVARNMNPDYLGDSYDIVKRFFCEALRTLGYVVYIEPMLTGEWSGSDAEFYAFLGVKHVRNFGTQHSRTALFIDPDTGVSGRASITHTSFDQLARSLEQHTIVFVFDQSFSRSSAPKEQMVRKLTELKSRGCEAFYYNSHARFLFTSRTGNHLQSLQDYLHSLGLPNSRILQHGAYGLNR
jgi:hypothetical protein